MTDDEALELWNERAAVREYDGQTSRLQAEFLAAKDVRRMLGKLPQCLAEAVRKSKQKGTEQQLLY